MKKTSKKIVYSIAHCNECLATWEGLDRQDEIGGAARWATNHTRMTSHNVTVEQVVHYQVLGRGFYDPN
jgi:hypothetical protein